MLHLESSPVHEQYNPYTAVQRSASQHFVYVPDLQPLRSSHSLTSLVASSYDAMYFNVLPPTTASITSLLSSQYVVPDMISPAYASASDVDTRSVGNPYSHHPNFTTPALYFEHLPNNGNEEPERDVLTIMDIARLENPFHNYVDMSTPAVRINPPNDVTINKNAFDSDSLADLHALEMEFPLKGGAPTHVPNYHNHHGITLNKKMLSPESMYELEQIPDEFQLKHEEEPTNLLKIREFSPQSLADLRELRNISQYTDFNDATMSSKDVATCLGISPSPHEVEMFERTENVAYGGI